ncbi:hypothetical protein PGB34_03225 [Xenophilus arseniciresistens]|uniref:Uncharacterized protein n=1 Tax=Xenophilus arseniciresistens TaxID=1283306 RepID=A0AAE3N526_9BURK|nr:hypothetical protein [Xenophilus arseniciresistens]MDA7415366.1 hypothetical protein [Xenophilus arseniciresistens]
MNPVPQRYPFTSAGASVVNSLYVDLVGNDHVVYGARSVSTLESQTTTIVTVYDPPLTSPKDQQPGQVVTHNSTARITVTQTDGSSSSTESAVKTQATYIGRETVQTPLGDFANACKFKTVFDNSPSSNLSWVPSDGPYRGQVVKAQVLDSGGNVVQTTESIRMVYTPK